MRRFFSLVAAFVLLVGMAGPVRAASITLNESSPSLGSVVTFTVTVDKKYDCNRKGCARVLINCYQAGELVYGEGGSLGQARGDGTDPLGYTGFLLGGGGSIWLTNGGPADCEAILFRYDNSGPVQTFVEITSATFAAAG